MPRRRRNNTSGSGLLKVDRAEIRLTYEQLTPVYSATREEAEFIIKSFLTENNIKIHSVDGRIKELDSLLKKAERKGYSDPLSSVRDIVGIRVVCLFRSD